MQDEVKERDLADLLRPYENKWVALSIDHTRILGTGDTLKQAQEQAKKPERNMYF